jgi:hypothetical protein
VCTAVSEILFSLNCPRGRSCLTSRIGLPAQLIRHFQEFGGRVFD